MKFEEVWQQILLHEGEVFYTTRGLDFTYQIIGSSLIPSRTPRQISQADFKKAFLNMPLSGPGDINNLVQGPS